METSIPVFIVTGFLGAGKTTVLRRLIEETTDRRFAVIVNEFGDMGFDGDLIEACCQDVVELKNGCICCRVGDDLIPALENVIERDRPPDAILIETSGLALPQPVVDAFAFPTVKARAKVAGVVVVADGPVLASGTFDAVIDGLAKPPRLDVPRPSGLHYGTLGDDDPIGEVFEDQLRAADLVILSKLDEMSGGDGADLRARLRAVLPQDVSLASALHGRTDTQTLLSVRASQRDKPSRHGLESTEHEHDDFDAAVLDLGEIEDRNALASRVAKAVQRYGLLRVKGFIAAGGAGHRFTLQATPTSTTIATDRPWRSEERRATRLVAIGLKGSFSPAILEQEFRDTP